jgi:membrane fusion protein (multidrug efflux system)
MCHTITKQQYEQALAAKLGMKIKSAFDNSRKKQLLFKNLVVAKSKATDKQN